MKPPDLLLNAFRAAESIDAIAVLMVDEGFDAVSMRVLAALQNVEQSWTAPKTPAPDDGSPTSAAWRWLLSGWQVDVDELARSADVTRQVARTKLAVIQNARLAYPDGSFTTAARQAIKSHIAARLLAGGKRKKKSKDEDAN